MLQPRISGISASRDQALTSLATALNSLALCSRHAPAKHPAQLTFTRHASHAAQGRANGPKDSAGRRLGAKKTSTEYVIPGNIIFKQRGTKWFPGENVGMGKDHTIYSTAYGYVRYYKDPAVHPKRRFIGVALEKEGPRSKLPTPPNAPTRRRLGMYLVPIKQAQPSSEVSDVAFLRAHLTDGKVMSKPPPTPAPASSKEFPYALRRGGHGMANHEIGWAAERKGVRVKIFDRKDRWTAWRVRAKKAKEKQLLRAAKANTKTKGKKSNKKVKIPA